MQQPADSAGCYSIDRVILECFFCEAAHRSPSSPVTRLLKNRNREYFLKYSLFLWCRWPDSNRYGIATGGFWVHYVCQFHHTGVWTLFIIHDLREKIKRKFIKPQKYLIIYQISVFILFYSEKIIFNSNTVAKYSKIIYNSMRIGIFKLFLIWRNQTYGKERNALRRQG